MVVGVFVGLTEVPEESVTSQFGGTKATFPVFGTISIDNGPGLALNTLGLGVGISLHADSALG